MINITDSSLSSSAEKQNRFLVTGIILFFVYLLFLGILVIYKYISDPDVAILCSEKGAKWIRFPEPTDLFAKAQQDTVHAFRTYFSIESIPKKAILNIKAMKHAGIFLDKQLIYTTDHQEGHWKKTHRIDLGPLMSIGKHEIFIKILNDKGHPALLAFSEPLNTYSNEHWEASKDGITWVPVVLADKIQPSELSRRFERTDLVLLKKLNLFLPVFIIVFILVVIHFKCSRYNSWLKFMAPRASHARIAIICFWIVLAVNNIGKIPLDIGMDVHKHFDYIRYVEEKWRIPFPDEGIKMFESPLFYILSAIIYKISLSLISTTVAVYSLRLIPLLCGIIQVELCYRALRYVYPGRADLQLLGTVCGGLIPMNLYMSQVAGTEPLVGALTGAVIVLTFRILLSRSSQRRELLFLIGFFWGLAILTKVTAVLLFIPLIFFCIYSVYNNKANPRGSWYGILKKMFIVIGIAFLVSGWYYGRNWIATGKPFFGGWDASRGFIWWQDPGYRTPAQLLTFGEALFYPVFAGVVGFWDALYCTFWMDGFLSGIGNYARIPPWNYDFMLSSAWFSLLPTAAILLGIIRSVKRPVFSLMQGSLFAVGCIMVYFFSILYLFLTVPIYSTAKATYTMGLIPCYAIFSAGGIEILTRNLMMRATVYGIFFCWIISVCGAYFVM